jgi:S-adenosylmethionine-diacylglycerol 3-amino-3-carboxypropyl transferase
VLSIASAGDNSLALLATGAEVVAADLNPAQLACLELRREAIRQLPYERLLGFLGVSPDERRAATYRELAAGLSADARACWDAQPEAIARGIVHAGRFERYFHTFRQRVLPLVHSRRMVAELLAPRPPADRRAFYDDCWDTWRWRLLFRLFFSEFVMGRMGRDPAFFRYVEVPVATRILARTRYALTALPTHDNPYLAYILTGNFAPALPDWLQPATVARIRASLDRLTLYRGTVQDAARQHGRAGFDAFNLSDIFEYLDEQTCRAVYTELLAHARPGARLAYWNMLAPRRLSRDFPDRVRWLEQESQAWFARDRAWFYSAFVAEEVRR